MLLFHLDKITISIVHSSFYFHIDELIIVIKPKFPLQSLLKRLLNILRIQKCVLKELRLIQNMRIVKHLEEFEVWDVAEDTFSV